MPDTGTMPPHMEPLGFLQLRVMHHIWHNGPATVHDVHDALNAQPDAPKQLAYTTFLTVMRNLAKRSFLDQKSEATRSHRFEPLITEAAYELAMVRQMRVELFGGDVGRMMMRIAEDEEIEARKRERIQALAVEG